jgi:hypothetical protein
MQRRARLLRVGVWARRRAAEITETSVAGSAYSLLQPVRYFDLDLSSQKRKRRVI